MKNNNNNTILSDEDYEEHEKSHEHAEDFHGQPPIVTDVVQILQQFTLRLVDVHDDVFDVFVDANGHLALFVDHGGELLENAAEFGDGALDVLHGVGARGGVVLVLVLVDGDLVLVEGYRVHVAEIPLLFSLLLFATSRAYVHETPRRGSRADAGKPSSSALKPTALLLLRL